MWFHYEGMRLYGYFRRLIEVATIGEKTDRGLIELPFRQ